MIFFGVGTSQMLGSLKENDSFSYIKGPNRDCVGITDIVSFNIVTYAILINNYLYSLTYGTLEWDYWACVSSINLNMLEVKHIIISISHVQFWTNRIFLIRTIRRFCKLTIIYIFPKI